MLIHLKDTTIDIICDTAEELHSLYFNLGHKYIFEIDGEEIKKIGPEESNNENVKSYFAGYTVDWFRNKFFNTEGD